MYSPPDPGRFNTLVWLLVRQIPPGKVSTYGQITSMIPPPDGVDPPQYDRLGAIWVGNAMAAAPDEGVPWQRVVNSQRKISRRAAAGEQRRRLEAEGVVFDDRERIDFALFGWDGPHDAWLKEHGLLKPRPLSPSDDSAQMTLF